MVTPPPESSRLTPGQLEILELVWEHQPCTVTFLWERLRASRNVARNTVHTQVQRLEQAGWLSARQKGRSFEYRVRVRKERTQKERLLALVDQLFGGSSEGLVQTLLQERPLDADALNRLRRVLEEEERRARGRSP